MGINYSELIFLIRFVDSAVSSLKTQDVRPKYHIRFSTTSSLLLLGKQLTDTEYGGIEETEYEYSSQTGCASFTSDDVSPVKK